MKIKSTRKDIDDLLNSSPLPSSEEATESQLKEIHRVIELIAEPVTDDDAIILLDSFGPDECFGLAWPLIHLIETSPNWPNLLELSWRNGYCIDLLKARCRASGYNI